MKLGHWISHHDIKIPWKPFPQTQWNPFLKYYGNHFLLYHGQPFLHGEVNIYVDLLQREPVIQKLGDIFMAGLQWFFAWNKTGWWKWKFATHELLAQTRYIYNMNLASLVTCLIVENNKYTVKVLRMVIMNISYHKILIHHMHIFSSWFKQFSNLCM